MGRRTLTAAAVAKIRAPESGRVEHWDAALPGFGLRITENGRRSWVLMTRVHGRLVRVTLGRYPAVGLAAAREFAREAIHLAARGDDPRLKKHPERANAATFAHVAEAFLARDQRAGPTWSAERARLVRRELLPIWGTRPIASLTRRDVIDVLETIAARAPIQANRTHAVVARLFRWAVNQDLAPGSPCVGLERPGGRERKRERVLTDAETVALWHAADTLGPVFGPYVKILLLTAQRRGEVAGMRWTDLDLADGLWRLPTTKAGHGHEVPLAPAVCVILQDVPRIGESPFVFSTNGHTPISGFSKVGAALSRAARVGDWRIHDLRRTAATGMARFGVPKATISRILNHAEGGVTSLYARHGYLDEKREALETWAARVAALVAPGASRGAA